MTTQDEAVETIISRSIVASHQGVLVSGIIKAVLADVPLLMQALGARHGRSGRMNCETNVGDVIDWWTVEQVVDSE